MQRYPMVGGFVQKQGMTAAGLTSFKLFRAARARDSVEERIGRGAADPGCQASSSGMVGGGAAGCRHRVWLFRRAASTTRRAHTSSPKRLELRTISYW